MAAFSIMHWLIFGLILALPIAAIIVLVILLSNKSGK